LDQFIQNGGQNYPPGVRKRLALARAVAADGKLVILDEIHNGLDQSGLAALMNVLQDMITAGKTIVLCSHDRSVIKTGAMVLDLNIKPTPRLEEV
jgi:ATP-binding cassette subfamily C protein LapB